MGLCVITTRLPVADIADHERTSGLRRDLDQLSSDDGAKLLRALGVKGHEAELRSASDEFSGHCLALTLLGSYLSDAYNGDVRCRKEVSARLAHDVRQGVHARKVMESYQTWFGEGPELSVLRMLGLFDRPADEKALGVLLKPPAISGLTESLTHLSPTAWKECNRRLCNYYRTLAPPLPDSFRDMEVLFLAVICGCNAGMFCEVLHEIYIPRIQRGNASFAASVLGVSGALLSVLVHFFENLRWDSPVEMGLEEQSLTAEDQLFILMQAAAYLTATRGSAAPEVRICYERAESLCHSLDRPLLLYVTLIGQLRHTLVTDRLSAAMQVAERAYSLAQKQDDPTQMIWAYNALAATLFFLGDFESTRQFAMRAVEIWHSGGSQSHRGDVDTPVVGCLCYGALSEWHLGEIASCRATKAEAISLAKKLNDMHALAVALTFGAVLAHFGRNPAEVERLASDLIELATRQNFVRWLHGGEVLRGWARSASGDTAEGISWIEDGIRDYRATGSMLIVPYWLTLEAEALYLAHRTSEAIEALREAEAFVERFEERHWCAELHRLRGVFLAAMGAGKTQIEASFCAAIRIAREQKSVSLEKRAEGTCAEYRRKKASRPGRRRCRLPLC
jgi:tetratricopeptide (TPR) repeat protein